jgi:hypothetical protein
MQGKRGHRPFEIAAHCRYLGTAIQIKMLFRRKLRADSIMVTFATI